VVAAAATSNTAADTAVYTYFFNHTLALLTAAEPFDPEDVDPLGVFHGSELVFVFDFEAGQRTQGEKDLAKAFASFWTSFAAAADPNSKGDAGTAGAWPKYSEASDEVMVLTTPPSSAAAPTSGLKHGKCDFWDANPIPSEVVFGVSDF